MKLNPNKIVLSASSLLIILLLGACHTGHRESDGHHHGSGPASGGHRHEGESPTTASLTEEQIRTVGLTLGNLEQKNLTATIKVNGVLKVPNKNKANVTPLYGGVVKTLTVELGDHVRKGQVIATIENPQFIQLQEEYLTLHSRITLAGQELQRQQELVTGNAGVMRNLQNATADLNTLRTRQASLHRQIQMMGIDPAALTDSSLKSSVRVTSPISGTVGNIWAKIGSYADAASPVAEIIDNGLLHLDLQVFEKDLPKIRIGQVVSFTVTNNPAEMYQAKVFSIGSTFQSESKTIAVHSAILGDKKGLIDGMSITALIGIADVSTLAVPNEAIVEAEGKYFIFVRKERETGHSHSDDHDHHHDHHHETSKGKDGKTAGASHDGAVDFERIEVTKGVSDMGYTAITPVRALPPASKIVVKGSFFVNARLDDSAEHAHAH